MNVDELFTTASHSFVRLSPHEAFREYHDGGLIVDIRPEFQRRVGGEIPDSIVIERNHLEWRCDPTSDARIAEAVNHHVKWIICCDEGYSSVLAAISLQALGLHAATDIAGGFRAWSTAGLPISTPAAPVQPRRPHRSDTT